MKYFKVWENGNLDIEENFIFRSWCLMYGFWEKHLGKACSRVFFCLTPSFHRKDPKTEMFFT